MGENPILFGKSGFNQNAVNDLNRLLKGLEDVQIVLMADGVMGSVNIPNSDETEKVSPYSSLIQAQVPLFVTSEDLTARGYTADQLQNPIQAISYGQMLDKIATATRVISWL